MTTPKQIGRFQVGRRLGAGSQGTAFLCHDSELERRVTIKLLDKMLPETSFRDEARTMSRLQHPNIVSIYEAGHHEDTPYLVFEYVEGTLLSDLLRGQPLELGRAMHIFEGLLEGMNQAHKAGIVHHDLKPSNIMISAEQTPKIMDFGIARLLSESHGPERQRIGTPRYLAPEYITHGELDPRADVFALGLILHEMLTGVPAFNGATEQAVIDAVLTVKPTAPSRINGVVDERLDRFVLKAVEKDPALRYADAGEMLRAFNEIRRAPGAAPRLRSEAGGTIEFLMRRMERQRDFPALSQSVRRINAVSHAGNEHINQIVGIIVKDFALTNKVLKVVNSARYYRFSGHIGTVSRAVVVLGIQAIRSLVASLIFFEHLRDKAHADYLRNLVSTALFRATLAQHVAGEIEREEAEEYFLSGMLSDLGRILVAFYLPEEARAIEQLATLDGREPTAAQHSVLGAGFEKIGMEVARTWNFPDALVDSMRRWEGEQKPINRTERKRLVNAFTDDAVKAMTDWEPDTPPVATALVERYAAALRLDPQRIPVLIRKAVDDFLEMADALGTDVPRAFVKKLLLLAALSETQACPPDIPPDLAGLDRTAILDDEGTRPANTGAPRSRDDHTPPDAETLLMDGLQEVTNMLVTGQSVSEAFNIVLETMYRAVGFRRVVLALKDNRTGDICARLSFGDADDIFMRGFRFPAVYSVDVFHGALKNVVDVYVADAASEQIRSDLPEWYRKISRAGSFLLFPLVINNRPVGLIYADHAKARGLDIDKKRLNLLRALRNQILLGLKIA
jgi:serine/threonine protein kinase